MKQVNDIPGKIDISSRDIVKDIKGNLNATQESLNGFKDAIQNMKDSALKGVGLDDKKKTLKSSEKHVDALRQYTGALGWGLTGIQFLCVFLVLIGAVIVILAYMLNLPDLAATGNEDKRKIKTTHGGKIIYCGMMVFILFAWIFMLMCLVFFAIGASLEGLICQLVNDPDFTIIDKLMADKRLAGVHNGTWLAVKVLSIPTSSASIGSVIRDCRDDKTLFKATDMADHPSANFTKLVDFKDQLNITALLSGVNVDVGNVDLLSGDVDQYLKYMDALQDHVPFAQLQNLSSEVNATAKSAEFEAKLAAPQRQNFSAAVNGNLREIERLTEKIEKNSAKLQASLGDIKTQTNNSRTDAIAAQSMIPIACGEEKPKVIETFVNRLNMMIETFTNESKRGDLFRVYA
ncbi:prominin-1-like [Littorina saxatilis]|uniref:prominin-1-like n=1 Tax=Littorina saxatilis TaxID=31220 RepID=UPI0038B4D513